jgi:hypothetical protein
MSTTQKPAVVNVMSFMGATLPLLFTMAVVLLAKLGKDPLEVEREVEELAKRIAESEWATKLARAMATTPEAQEKVRQLLARELARKIVLGTSRW